MTESILSNLKGTILYQSNRLNNNNKFLKFILVLPWVLPKKIHDSVLLVTDIDNSRKVKSLRFLLTTILKHQSNKLKTANSDDRQLIQSIQHQNAHLSAQLLELQRTLNSVSTQCRLQQEDHFELERRLMEFKFGRDPMMMSSDSVFENGSIGSLSIDMRNIDQVNTSFKC